MAKLYTIGYGIANWHDFFHRLLDADISCIVDIRRKGSKSRNGKAFWWGCSPYSDMYMGDLLFEAGIEYFTVPGLSKPTDQSMTDFREKIYRMIWDIDYDKGKISCLFLGYLDLRQIIREFGSGNICLLCCERDYRRCHRRIVAEVVAGALGLEVVHL